MGRDDGRRGRVRCLARGGGTAFSSRWRGARSRCGGGFPGCCASRSDCSPRHWRLAPSPFRFFPPVGSPVWRRWFLIQSPSSARCAPKRASAISASSSGAGASGRALGRRLAGEQVLLAGSIVWVSPGDRLRLVHRHLLARVTLDAVELAGRGPPWARAANRIRRTLTDGARSLPPPNALHRLRDRRRSCPAGHHPR